MSQSLVALSIDGSSATLTLDRPAKLNALNHDLLVALDDAVAALERAAELRVVVIRGSGRAFSVGLDLAMVADGVPVDFFELQERVYRRIEELPAVTISVVHGHCLGGAIQLALTADVRICCQDTHLGMPAVEEGMFPGMMPFRLARTVGPNTAMRLMLSGGDITVPDALASGLVNHVVPQLDPSDELDSIVDSYRRAPHSVPLTKRLIQRGLDGDYQAAYEDSMATLKAGHA